MCERFIHLQPALAAMAVDNKLPASIEIIRQVHRLLKPFKDAQLLLEGDKYVTLYLFFHMLSKPSELPC